MEKVKPNWSKKKSDENVEDWMTTYGDMVTLLLTFFVMLASISKVEIPLYEQVAAGIQKEIGKKETESPIALMKIDLQDAIYSLQAEKEVVVGTDDRGVVLEFASTALYRPGSAEVKAEGLPLLGRMAETLNSPRYRGYLIEVEGHTDDDPIATAQFPSNWELSAGRATRVARTFIDFGVAHDRLKATGYAETRPLVPNRTADGIPIKENQAKNRRVIIRIYPKDFDVRKDNLPRVTAQELADSAAEGGAEGSQGEPRYLEPVMGGTRREGVVSGATGSGGPAEMPRR
jgi:chemotaxis protein MotB